MKLLIYFFIGASIFAQDSLKIKLLSMEVYNRENDKELFSDADLEINLGIKPLVHTPVNRNWARAALQSNSNIIKNYSASTVLNFSKKKQNFIDSDLFLIVVGSAVVFGTAAAYFKLESDKYYDKYQLTDDRKYFDKTNNFDIYSGIALGAMEINFGYLIYKFLTD